MKSGPDKNPPPARRAFWQRLRIYFRRIRAAVWTLIIAVILAVLWLNQVGLPGFIKRPLLEQLRARGVELQFTNLRLSWSRGFVAYDVRFGRAADPATPQFSARRVEIPLKLAALCRGRFEIGGFILDDGLLVWTINESDQPRRELIATNLQTTVHFLPHDAWRLDDFQVRIAGVKIALNGELTHASAIRNWRTSVVARTNVPGPAPGPRVATPDRLRQQLRQFDDAMQLLIFSQPPGLRVSLYGDARDFRSFKLAANFTAPKTVTPLGILARTRLDLRSAGFAPVTNAGPPALAFARIQTQLDGGEFDLAADFDFTSRALHFRGASALDLMKIRLLLPTAANHWLSQITWERAPQIYFAGGSVLLAGTNSPAARRDEFLEAMHLDADFQIGPAAYRNIPIRALTARIAYSNHLWRLPEFKVTRTEGSLRGSHWTDLRTQDFYWRLQGVVDPKAAHPLLNPAGQHALDLVGLTTPPELDVELFGRWQELERFGVAGRVALSNFTFRGESGTSLQTAVRYTNLWLHLGEPRVTRSTNGEQRGSLTSVDMDFRNRMLYLTNGVSTIDPMVIARAVGVKTTAALEPYQFLRPPSAHVEGAIHVGGERIADLQVRVAGGPFHWWKFNVPQISGDVHWLGDSLTLTNVTGDFYGGSIAGNAAFDFTPQEGSRFLFNLTATNTSLAELLADLAGNSNRLEGRVSGRLAVTQAESRDIMSWQGHGAVALRDGLLWEIPVFGVFAPALNSLWPNLGSGRASDGGANFTISNSIVRTDNLELRSPMMRLQYRGSADFAGNLDARVEAEPLRDTWVIGPMVSTVLRPIAKALEFKVTGTLAQPQAAPVYIPKVFLLPFSPVQSLRELFPEKPAATNAPPEFLELP